MAHKADLVDLQACVDGALQPMPSVDDALAPMPLEQVPGLGIGVAVGSVKAPGRTSPDVVVLTTSKPAAFAAVTTTSTAAAAPCLWTRARVPGLRRAVGPGQVRVRVCPVKTNERTGLSLGRRYVVMIVCSPQCV